MTRWQKNLTVLVISAVLNLTLALPSDWSNRSPVETDGFYVAIFEESADRPKLSKDILATVSSTIPKVATTELGGKFRLIDPVDDEGNPVDLSKDDPIWSEMAAVERESVPWTVIASPNGGYSGPTRPIDETVEQIREFGESQ